jgi:hypothetical protein
MKNNFYFKGKYFEKEKDFWEYVHKWGDLELNEEAATRELERFSTDLLMNAFIKRTPLKNQEFIDILVKTFEFYIKELHKEIPEIRAFEAVCCK